MARGLRFDFPGAVHHVMARGNNGRDIFDTADAGQRFLSILADTVERNGWQLYSYCLMPNHYHLLIETPAGGLGRGMKRLNGVYTQWYNAKQARTGHLYQGRYRSKLVDKDAYLLQLVRYIARNPVRAGLADQPERWLWSSSRALFGQVAPPAFLNCAAVWHWFDPQATAAPSRLRAFVDAPGASALPEEAIPGIYGGRSFVGILVESGRLAPVPAFVRRYLRPDLEELRRQHPGEQEWLQAAHVTHGYGTAEIAAAAGTSRRTVRRRLNQLLA